MAGLALVTPRTVVHGGHGLAVKTLFRFNPSSPNKDECCGRGWLTWIREGSGGGQASLTAWRSGLEVRLCGRGAFEGVSPCHSRTAVLSIRFREGQHRELYGPGPSFSTPTVHRGCWTGACPGSLMSGPGRMLAAWVVSPFISHVFRPPWPDRKGGGRANVGMKLFVPPLCTPKATPEEGGVGIWEVVFQKAPVLKRGHQL